jgi:predicted GIY-YIG superfamily endonuclease
MFYVYVLRSEADFGFYIDYTNNLRARLKEHEVGNSFATAHRKPWRLIYYEWRDRRFIKAQLRNDLAENGANSTA